METMNWILYILIGFSALVLLVLLFLAIPVRYRIEADGRQADVTVSAGFGLWRKRKICRYEELFRARETVGESTAGETVSEEKNDSKETVFAGWHLLRQAFRNGTVRLVFEAIRKIIRHSVSSSWRLTGRVGLFDPMETGMLAGLCAAFFPKICPEWDFTGPCADFKLKAGGRIFPLYMIFVFMELARQAPVRETLAYGRNL